MVRNHRSANGGNVTGKRRSDEVVNEAGINVTHPQKIWLPEEKITKLDVAQYYAAVAPRILHWDSKYQLLSRSA